MTRPVPRIADGVRLPRRGRPGGARLIAVLALVALLIGGLGYFWLSQVRDQAERRQEFLDLHDAAVDRIDKGPESEFGPEVVEEYHEEAARRRELLLRIQPDLPGPQTKRCGACGEEVSWLSQAGDRCPHCGAKWTREITETGFPKY